MVSRSKALACLVVASCFSVPLVQVHASPAQTSLRVVSALNHINEILNKELTMFGGSGGDAGKQLVLRGGLQLRFPEKKVTQKMKDDCRSAGKKADDSCYNTFKCCCKGTAAEDCRRKLGTCSSDVDVGARIKSINDALAQDQVRRNQRGSTSASAVLVMNPEGGGGTDISSQRVAETNEMRTHCNAILPVSLDAVQARPGVSEAVVLGADPDNIGECITGKPKNAIAKIKAFIDNHPILMVAVKTAALATLTVFCAVCTVVVTATSALVAIAGKLATTVSNIEEIVDPSNEISSMAKVACVGAASAEFLLFATLEASTVFGFIPVTIPDKSIGAAVLEHLPNWNHYLDSTGAVKTAEHLLATTAGEIATEAATEAAISSADETQGKLEEKLEEKFSQKWGEKWASIKTKLNVAKFTCSNIPSPDASALVLKKSADMELGGGETLLGDNDAEGEPCE